MIYDEAFHLAFTPTQACNNDFLNGDDNLGLEEVNENDAYNPTVVPMAYSHPTTLYRKTFLVFMLSY